MLSELVERSHLFLVLDVHELRQMVFCFSLLRGFYCAPVLV